MNARVCYCVVAAIALILFINCAEAHDIHRVARCNHDEIQMMTNRLNTRDSNTQTQQYVNETLGTIEVGPMRIYLEIVQNNVNDVIQGGSGSMAMACVHENDDIFVKGRPYKCEKADLISEENITAVRNLITGMRSYIQTVFQVNRAQKLEIEAGTYGGVLTLPDISKSSYDLYLEVTFRPDSWDVYASGTSLVYDQNGRPIVGLLNWNPRNLHTEREGKSALYKLKPEGLYERVLLHEMIHILGFSQARMLNFHNSSSMDIATGYSDPYLEIPVTAVENDNREQSFLRSPKVKQAFREQTGCEDAPGAVLEDQGGNEVAGSHWEMSVMMDELMTATVTERSILSNVTLAAMEDSGWYYINYTAVNGKSEYLAPLLWNKNKGCDFVYNRCNSSWPRGEGYYCTEKGKEDCTYDKIGMGTCDLRYWSVIPEKYRYLSDNHTGGPVDYADFCPYTYPTFFCDEKRTKEASSYGDVTGSDSRCFISTLSDSPDSASKQPSAPKCYPRHCITKDSYAVKIGNYWYPCPSGGEIKEVISFSGTLSCPSVSLLCFDDTEDTDFPVFVSVEPTSAEAGSTIRIFGRNIKSDASITLGAPCEDIQVNEEDGSISCTIALTSELSAEAGVKNIIIKQNGYSLAVPNAFTLQLSTKAWILKNWFIVVCGGIGIVVLVLTFVVICCKCCSTSKKWKVYQEAINKKKKQSSATFDDDIEFDSLA